MSCRGHSAWALWYLGYPDQALQRNQGMLALARELAHPYTLAWVLNAASWTHWYRREGKAAYTLADEVITLSATHDFPHWLAMGLQMQGQALIGLGQWKEGTAQLQQGIEAYRATGAILGTRGCNFAELARGYAGLGRIEEGLRLLTEALAVTNETGVRHYEAEMYRLKGTLTLQSKVQDPKSQVQEAEECFHKAIEIACHQQAKSWELRASTNLARLWQQQGKRAEAHKLLSEIYNWFTEGFDTKDLQEAKALLEELPG
jgi:predicted ATPase